MTTPPATGAGYPVHQVIDGNLDVLDVSGTGLYGTITARQIIAPVQAGLAPSGDTSGATDAAAINGLFSAGVKVVLLQAGTFYVNATIVVPADCALIGAFPVAADNFSNYGAGSLQPQGTVITAAGAFVSGSPSFPVAVVACQNATSSQQGAQVLANFSIQANTTPAGSGVFGILLDGAVGAGFIDNVMVVRSDGACLRARTDSTSGFQPDQWRITNSLFAGSRSSHGVQLQNLPDTTFLNCLAHDNALDGWNVGSSTNSHFIGCRAETNHANGFHFTGFISAGEFLSMDGCSTHANQSSGYLFDSSAFSALGTYQLTGCMAEFDGQSATAGLAGFLASACKSRVMLTGCSALKNGSGPYYGAAETSVSYYLQGTGCYFEGVNANTFDDTSNTHVLSSVSPVAF